MTQPLRIALLGAGIFAREAHLPALLDLPNCEIVAIYSRTSESALALNALLPQSVPIYTDLDAVLALPDVDAVDVLLPITVMPDVIRAALQAGKHVISEKPVAPSVSDGRDLLSFSQAYPQLVWMVAENWRFAPAIVRAAQIVESGGIGEPLFWHWAIYTGLTPDNKYYQTAWRRAGDTSGGWMIDGGVHFAAGLRAVLGEVATAKTLTRLVRPDLHPVDSLAAAVELERGTIGTLAVTYAAGLPWATSLTISGSEGVLEVNRDELKHIVNGRIVEEISDGGSGVPEALAAFVEAARGGPRDERGSPEQALADLHLIERLLQTLSE